LDSGTNVAGRITDSTRSVDSPSWYSWVRTGDVLEVDDPEDVVEPVTHDRDAREAAAQRERECLAQGLRPLDEHHVRTRDHHLAHDRVAQLEDRVDHRAFLGLDQLALLREVDEVAQLGLGREGPLAEAAPRRDGVAEQDQQLRQRSEHAGHPDDERRARERDGVGMLAPEGARRDADGDVRHDDEDECGQQQRLPPRLDPVDEHGDHEDSGDELAGRPQQQQDVEVARGVRDDVRQLRGAAPPSRTISSVRTRESREWAASSIARRKATTKSSTAATISQMSRGHGTPPDRRSSSRHEASSWRCSPNISFSSSGSAWS
jgi:hypothetical protein